MPIDQHAARQMALACEKADAWWVILSMDFGWQGGQRIVKGTTHTEVGGMLAGPFKTEADALPRCERLNRKWGHLGRFVVFRVHPTWVESQQVMKEWQ